jgi:fucose 4-O-acetylase-like acetyltransferase
MEKLVTKENKIEWIDTVKGIGIISVIISHLLEDGLVANFINIFHMPLFFFISGYLFKPDKDNRKKFFLKKIIHLVVPYLSFLLMILVVQHFVQQTPFNKSSIKLFLWGGTELRGWTATFWFVSCLFFTQQIFKLLSAYNEKIIASVCMVFLSIAYINSYFFQTLSFPLAINIVFYSLPIMFMGYLYKVHFEKKTTHNIVLCTILFIVILFLCSLFPSITIAMKYSNYGVPLISLSCGIILTHIFIVFSKFLHIHTNMLSYIGQASMVIMYLHQSIQFGIKQYFTENLYVRFSFALLVPLIIYYILSKSSCSRFIFLGSVNDSKIICNYSKLRL